MSDVRENSKGLLFHIIGLVLVIALVWFVLAVLEGIAKILLVVLCFIIAVALVWRLIKATARK